MRNPVISLLLLVPATTAVAGGSHCAPGESIFFSCAVGKGEKVVLLCASRDLTATSGTLYYRFGAPAKIELEYPSRPHGAARKFKHAHYSRYQTSRVELSFAIGSKTYALFDYFEESQKPKYLRGVRVTTAGVQSQETLLSCKGPVTSRLYQLEDTVPCDADNALAQCNKD
jgi:hypothetical protein